MGQIFVSYSRQDADTVRPLVEPLRKDGHEVFMDIALPGGQPWREKIVAAIKTADVFALFLSPRSILSDEVRKELELASEEKKQIAPVIIERVTIPDRMRYPLAGLQLIDLTSSISGGEQLRKEIRSLVKEPGFAPLVSPLCLRGARLDEIYCTGAWRKPAEAFTPEPKPKPEGLAAILPGKWKVDVDSTATSLYRTEDNYVFSIDESGTFASERVSSTAQTGHTTRYSEKVEGTWVLESGKSVQFSHYPAGIGAKVSFTFTFELVKDRELRGSTDLHPLGRKRTLWRRV